MVVSINRQLKNIIINVVNYIFPAKNKGTKGRPPKCSNEMYLEAMFYVLKEGIGWEYLKGYPVNGDTIRKQFKKWSDYGVFNITWEIIVEIYSEFKEDIRDLFIDASHIKNNKGIDLTGANHYDRFRKATKLSIITDDIGVPIGIHIDKSNIHDSKLTIQTLNSIPIDISESKFLIGDRGYNGASLKEQVKNNYKLDFITQRKRKRGQKGKFRGRKPKNYEKLKNRFIVEHAFSWIKNYRRLYLRKDKQSTTFKNFIMFGIADLISKKLGNIINNN